MKKFKNILLSIISLFFIIGSINVIIDPFFHYHKPLSFLNYPFFSNQQRYINDGILKNFDYNAFIIGTSMTENFRTSEFDSLFNVNSVKVPFFGASYKEINDNLETGLKNKKNIKYVLRGLDYNAINKESREMTYKVYPCYLYDENIFNDYKYFLSRGSFFQSIIILIRSLFFKEKMNFDDYSRWNENFIPGKENILKTYKRIIKKDIIKYLSQEDIDKIDKNIKENVIKLPKEYPNVKFIYFITPYSIIYWDDLNQKGELEKQILAEKYMIEKILEIPNIELYSFFNNYEMITNLDNYRDAGHYMGNINDQILVWIKNKEYRLTKENYVEYINKNLDFYKYYNYDKIFKESAESL